MFAEYLQKHHLLELLKRKHFFPAAHCRKAWKTLAEGDRQELLTLAEIYRSQPYPLRKATDFMAFVHTGSRKADENPYFFRRRKLCAAALGYAVQPNRADLDEVIDGLWLICEESSWVISAHNVNPIPGAPAARDFPLPDVDAPYIDLFAAQTGMILALVADLLADELDAVAAELRRRVDREIHRRILQPFMTHDEFWWMGFVREDLNNWTPWIISGVMVVAVLHMQDSDGLAGLLTRACLMLDRYLACLPQDGGCDEGAGYWNLAGGALLDCLDVLEQVTEGQMTFWQEEKIRNIMAFPAKMQLAGDWFVNFADCDAKPLLAGERLQYAGERLSDASLMGLGCAKRGALADQLNDTPQLWRLLRMLFHPAAEGTVMPPADAYLPDLQVRVVRKGGMILACKGGHNGENHNHNDVGSFMLYVDGQPHVVDAGNMIYTAKTFSEERYTLWNVRSAYHNVPLIAGQEQQPGRAFAAKDVQCLPDGLALEASGAYGEAAGVKTFARRLTLDENALTLEDCITLSQPAEVTWVFMLRHEPAVERGCIRSGAICLKHDESLRAETEMIEVTDARMAGSFPGKLWRVKLTSALADMHKFLFVMEKNA